MRHCAVGAVFHVDTKLVVPGQGFVPHQGVDLFSPQGGGFLVTVYATHDQGHSPRRIVVVEFLGEKDQVGILVSDSYWLFEGMVNWVEKKGVLFVGVKKSALTKMVIKNVTYATMNGNIVWEDEPIRKVRSDFDESNFLEGADSI